MSGEEAHHKLKGSKSLGSIRTAKKYDLIDLGDGFKALTSGEDHVDGEVYRVTKAILSTIDEWEESVYERELIELEDGSRAYAYIL